MERMAQYTAKESDNGQIYVGHNIVWLKRVGTIWNIWHNMEGYNMERIAQTLYNTRHRSLIMAKYVGPALVAAALPRANSSSSLSFSSDDEEEVHDNQIEGTDGCGGGGRGGGQERYASLNFLYADPQSFP